MHLCRMYLGTVALGSEPHNKKKTDFILICDILVIKNSRKKTWPQILTLIFNKIFQQEN